MRWADPRAVRYRDKRSGEVVALKKIKMESGQSEAGFPLTSLREGKILMQFKHENIVNVTEIVVGKNLHRCAAVAAAGLPPVLT